MTYEQIAILALMALILVLFIWGRWRYDLVAFTGLLVAVVLGLVEPAEAFQGFGHPAVVTVAAVLILSGALANSGLISLLTRQIEPAASRDPMVHIGLLGVISATLSAFINNVGALALLMPVAIRSSNKAGRAAGLVLMPLAFMSILGGVVTLIGTPPNIIIANYRAEISGEPFAMFDFAPVGAPVALIGVLFVALVGWRLIPKARRAATKEDSLFDIDDYVTEARVPEEADIIGHGRRQIETLFNEHQASLVGLIRKGQRIHSAVWRGRISAGDILVIEAAPDGINDIVQALGLELVGTGKEVSGELGSGDLRSEERRVGKECRSRWSPYH